MTMKTTFLSALLVGIIFFSCKKSPVTPTPPGGGGNTGGGGLSITSITPLSPYCDDEITINGTGFDADKTKDTVKFGILNSSGNFSVPDANLCVINSATTTQLKIVISNSFNFGGNLIFLNPLAVARVNCPKGMVYSSQKVIFRVSPLCTSIQDANSFMGYNVARVGDSIFTQNAIGIGNNSLDNISINTTNFTPKIDSSSNCKFGFVLPNKLFGLVLDETVHQISKMTIRMKDGKTTDVNVDFYTSPIMSALCSAAIPSFIKSTAPSGAVETINVTGVNLKSDTKVEHTYPGGSDEGALSIDTEFGTKGSIIYQVSLLTVGTHNVRLFRMENGVKKYYGVASFIIYP